MIALNCAAIRWYSDFKLKCKTGATVKDRRIDVFWGESEVANVSLKSSYYVDLI